MNASKSSTKSINDTNTSQTTKSFNDTTSSDRKVDRHVPIANGFLHRQMPLGKIKMTDPRGHKLSLDGMRKRFGLGCRDSPFR